jgi:hypothetical protein
MLLDPEPNLSRTVTVQTKPGATEAEYAEATARAIRGLLVGLPQHVSDFTLQLVRPTPPQLTGYQIAYASAFAQAFNHYMQTRNLVPQGTSVNGVVADTRHHTAARDYARLQAELAAEHWAMVPGAEGP